MLPYIVEQMSKENISEPLTQNSSIFSVGTGKDSLGQEIDVSQSIVNGQVSDVKIKGLTVTNLVKNGNFADGTTGWTPESSSDVVDNEILQNTADGSATYGTTYQLLDIVTGSKYFIRAKLKVTNDVCRKIELLFGMGSVKTELSNPVQDKIYTISAVGTADTETRVRVRHNYADGATSSGKVMEVYEVMAIDLTATFGVGKEPTKEQCDLMFPNWFDGTKSTVGDIRLVSIGRNKFNNKNVKIGNYYSPTNTFANEPTSSYSPDYFRVKKGETLYFNLGVMVSKFDINKQHIERTTTIPQITIDFDGYIRLSAWQRDITGLMVSTEQGATYESHKESTVYISAGGELRSLPNGTNDEINVGLGQKIQRVSEDYVIKATDIDGIITRTNYMQAQLAFSRLPLPTVNGVDAIQGTFKIQGWSEKAYTSSGDYTPNMFATRAINSLSFDFPPGTTLEQARTALAGQALTYQLMSPVVEKADVDGTLYAYPNGTIYLDVYHRQNHTYDSLNNGLTFPYKITQIDKIEKLVDGVLTEITFTPIIAEDGLSATIAELVDGDMVTVYAPYDTAESTIAESQISYPINQKAQIMSNTANIQKHDKQIVNIESFIALAYAETQLELAKQDIRISANEQAISDLETRVTALENPV